MEQTDTASPRLKARYIAAATIGNALEFYDFITYSFFSIQIGHAFFPTGSAYGSLMLSLATFGVGFATRPVGAVVIGRFSDTAGRRAAMMLSFALMGFSILVIALIPSYSVIGIAAPIIAIITRMIQGFSLGGEVGPNVAFLTEIAPPSHRARAIAWQRISQNIAATAGGLMGLLLSQILSAQTLDTYGWRIAFLLGASIVPFGLWLRKGLPETLHLPESTAAPAARTRLFDHRRIILLGLLVLAGGTIQTYVGDYTTTYAQNTLHLSAASGFAVAVIFNLTGIAALFAGAIAADRLGRRAVMLWPNLAALVVTYPIFAWIVASPGLFSLLVGIGFWSVLSGIPFAGFYAALSESLPKAMRGGVFATIYALSVSTFGGTTQLVVTWLIHTTGNPLAPAWYLVAATLAVQIGMSLIPESAPVRLGTLVPVAAE